MLRQLARTSSVLFVAGCASLPTAQTPSPLALQRLGSQEVIVLTKITPPWYAFHRLILNQFRKRVPEFQKIAGLGRKSFAFSSDGKFGGFYWWSDRAQAEAFFGPAWHSYIKEKYSVDGETIFFPVSEALVAPIPPEAEGEMVTAISQGNLRDYSEASGLHSAWQTESRVISTWLSRKDAEGFLNNQSDIEWFETPVIARHLEP
jgi:hypothetical protein